MDSAMFEQILDRLTELKELVGIGVVLDAVSEVVKNESLIGGPQFLDLSDLIVSKRKELNLKGYFEQS